MKDIENFKMGNEIQIKTHKTGYKTQPLRSITDEVLRYAPAAWPDFAVTSSN